MTSRRIAAGIALLGALLVAIGLVWSSRTTEPCSSTDTPAPPMAVIPEGAVLVSDVGGPIARVALSAASARRSVLRNFGQINAIARALSPQTRLLILTNDREAFHVTSDPNPGRVRFVELAPEIDHTIWPQDPFLVLARNGLPPVLLTPARFERAGDEAMAEALAGALDWERVRSELFFEGGNVVSDGRTAFVGANTIHRNTVELGLDEREVVRRFERTLGLTVLVVGGLPQIVPHIDMLLTPLGGRRLALADAGRGAEIVQRALEQDAPGVHAFERATEEQFFAHPAIAELQTAAGEVLRAPKIRGETARAAEQSRALATSLDAMAAALAAHGYEVARIPILLTDPARAPDDRRRGVQDYPILSYDNVLLEHGSSGPRALLPQYGLEPLDRAAREAWSRLGYAVVPIEGFAISALYGGALRCSVKVLERRAR